MSLADVTKAISSGEGPFILIFNLINKYTKKFLEKKKILKLETLANFFIYTQIFLEVEIKPF